MLELKRGLYVKFPLRKRYVNRESSNLLVLVILSSKVSNDLKNAADLKEKDKGIEKVDIRETFGSRETAKVKLDPSWTDACRTQRSTAIYQSSSFLHYSLKREMFEQSDPKIAASFERHLWIKDTRYKCQQ